MNRGVEAIGDLLRREDVAETGSEQESGRDASRGMARVEGESYRRQRVLAVGGLRRLASEALIRTLGNRDYPQSFAGTSPDRHTLRRGPRRFRNVDGRGRVSTDAGALGIVTRSEASRTEVERGLVQAVRDGNERAFGTLVEWYMEPAYAIAVSILGNPADAEDAVQAGFIRALERMDQLAAGSPFGPWFYSVLRSTALNLRRREILRHHEEIPASAAGAADPERDMERTLARERLLKAMEELSEAQHTAVVLYDLEGYSHREIGKILGIAEGTSRAHVFHARKTLQEILKHDTEST